eukprot:gene21541-42211_t
MDLMRAALGAPLDAPVPFRAAMVGMAVRLTPAGFMPGRDEFAGVVSAVEHDRIE